MENKKDGKLKFVFFGTPDVASETLEILKSGGYLPALIVTSPDAKKGRGLQIHPSPTAIFAEKNNIACLKPEKVGELKELEKFDLAIVVAYGKILPEKIINSPKLGSINIHYSLLPKYRGASPVESAILNGDMETGVSIQKMAFKMDTGDILAQEKVPIDPDEKAPDLRKRLIKIGGELLLKTLPDLIAGKIKPIQQNESEATYCKKIEKEDGLINLEQELPSTLYNKFRAYANWPRIYFFKDAKRIIITDASFTNGEFQIRKVLPEGKKEITWEEFKRIK
jgi:methionyl-tRNA formyltransferase